MSWMIKGPSLGIGKGIDDGGDYAVVADGQIIADVIHRTGPNTYQDALGHARLMAAAPELLKAVQAAKELLIKDLDEPGRTVFWTCVWAIRKAEEGAP